MADPAAVQIEGAVELARLFRQVADRDLKTGLRGAHLAVATIVADRARPQVPYRTGRLQRSVRPAATQTSALVRMGGTADVAYQGVVNWGRVVGNVGSPPGNHKGPNPVTGRPVIWEEAQRAQALIVATYTTEISRVFDRALGR